MVANSVSPHSHRRRLLPSSSWSEIPEELLRLIFERISDWSDLHPCLGVCPLWRYTARPVLSRIIASAFLLLINPEQKRQPCKFLDSSATTFCIKARMELANYTIHDSNRGWLLMHSLSQEYSLYNPITREIVQLPSPPNGPFSNLVYINPPPAEAESKVFRIHKFVMSTSPRDPDCVVCILSQHRNNLAFCKPASSDKSFKLMTSARAGIYSDMIFYKGEFYAVNGFNELYVMKILERDNQIVAVQEHRVVLTKIQSSGKARQFYLAEEPVSKELLLVEKVKLLYWDSAQRKDLIMISKTVSFRFFKLKYKYYYNSAAATAVWEEVVRRAFQWDHHALLLVSGGSMFVSTDDDQTCSYKPNRIYFVDEFYNSDPLNYLKVYDLKSHTVEPFNFNQSCYNSQRLASDGLCTWFRASAV